MELEIGKRFKEYEASFWQVLPPRMPVIMRLDGRAFHTVTRRLHVAIVKNATKFLLVKSRGLPKTRNLDPRGRKSIG